MPSTSNGNSGSNGHSGEYGGDAVVNQDVIAEKLHLSKATVSRALRNLPGIHPSTRSRVMEAAAQMGYRPQRTRVRPGATETEAVTEHRLIGVMVRSRSEQWRSLPFITGMAEMATALNVSLVLQHVGLSDAGAILDPHRQPPALRDDTLSGVVLIHRWPEAVVRYLAERYPCVSLVHRLPDVPMDIVDMDHGAGMLRLMRRLYELGHRQIGFIGRSRDLSWSKARYGAYVEALYALGLPYDPAQVIDVPTELLEDNSLSWDEPVERAATLARSQGVRAWMGASDWAGYSLCRGLIDRGLRIPEDISVTGFDTREYNTLGCPPLTSVRVPLEPMGAEALRRVVRRAGDPSYFYQCVQFDCALREGETTGPALRHRSGG